MSSESVNEPLDQTDIFQMTSRFAEIIPPYHRRGNRVFSTASLLVKQHGEDAPIHAAVRVVAMLEAGDLDGYAVRKKLGRRDRSRSGWS